MLVDVRFLTLMSNTLGSIPTWPTMVKPVGNSSCSSSGRMADMISSVDVKLRVTRYMGLTNIHTVGPVIVGQFEIVDRYIDLLLADQSSEFLAPCRLV